MKLLLVNGSRLRFTVEMPAREPLGGTESACAYLTQAMALRGHDVSLMCNLPQGAPERAAGVRHLALGLAQDAGFFARENFEAIVALSTPQAAPHLKQIAPRALHVAWLHLPPNQAVRDLIAKHSAFMDWAVFVSQSQRAATSRHR